MKLRALARKVGLTNERVRYIIERNERNARRRDPDAFAGLSVRVRNCLRHNGIDTPEDLVVRWTASKLTDHLFCRRRYPVVDFCQHAKHRIQIAGRDRAVGQGAPTSRYGAHLNEYSVRRASILMITDLDFLRSNGVISDSIQIGPRHRFLPF